MASSLNRLTAGLVSTSRNLSRGSSADIESITKAVAQLGVSYYQGSYSPKHWAMQPYRLGDVKVIALAQFAGSRYAFFLNPMDQRGYRSITLMVNDKDPRSTFNRDYEPNERRGLSYFQELGMRAYKKVVPLVQLSEAGNNSHEYDPIKKEIRIGKPDTIKIINGVEKLMFGEPSLLHSHIIGRGIPNYEYVEGVPFQNPDPGQLFDMREGKVLWKPGQMDRVASRIREEVIGLKSEYEAIGLKVVTSYTDIFLTRHGVTPWNTDDRLQGHSNIDLNDAGRDQAHDLKKRLQSVNFSAAYSSDLSRAYETAMIVIGERDVKVHKLEDLREKCMGLWEGRLTSEMRSQLPSGAVGNFSLEELLSHKWDVGAESYREVYQRFQGVMEAIAYAHKDANVLVSTHGGLIRSVLYTLGLESNTDPKVRWEVYNCAHIKLRVYETGEAFIVETHGIKPGDPLKAT